MAQRYAARWLLPMTDPPVRDGAVVVEAGRIVGIERRRPADPVVADVLLPGLVNAHAHLEYGAAFADLATSAAPFHEWLPRLVGQAMTLDDAAWRRQAVDSARQMLATGTTCVADVVTFGPGVAAAAELGLAGVSYVEAVAADLPRWGDGQRAHVHQLLEAAPGARTVGLSPHAPYTVSVGVYEELLLTARDRDLRLHTHIAESPAETSFVHDGTGFWADFTGTRDLALELRGCGSGRTPVRWLDSLGGLGEDMHVAHGVHVDAAERALLRERKTVVALCPRSNEALGVGEAPVAAYLAEGNAIAIGTDSLASTPDLDLLAEARALAAVARSQGARSSDLPRQVLAAATLGGAAAMGLPDVGHLSPGARADLAAFRVADSQADPYEALLRSGRCVATMLAGSWLAPAVVAPQRP